MTEEQKKEINTLREDGKTISDISVQLSLSYSSIKAYCQRNGIKPKHKRCMNCGEMLNPVGFREKRFCSRECYVNWWEKHQRKRTQYHCICSKCGNEFSVQSKSRQKYCSRACFYAARKGGNCNG